MNKIHADLPDRIETERLYLRPYQPGDGPLFFAASLRNRSHLSKYESENILMHLKDQEHAEAIIREMASDWAARNCFFIGIFEKATGEWVGQVYVGPTTWEPPEFSIGYVADVNHQGLGYITEAVTAVLRVLFENLHAHRVTADCHEDNLRS
jgi:RimJ/RimL family protein N-acetyltransferase